MCLCFLSAFSFLFFFVFFPLVHIAIVDCLPFFSLLPLCTHNTKVDWNTFFYFFHKFCECVLLYAKSYSLMPIQFSSDLFFLKYIRVKMLFSYKMCVCVWFFFLFFSSFLSCFLLQSFCYSWFLCEIIQQEFYLIIIIFLIGGVQIEIVSILSMKRKNGKKVWKIAVRHFYYAKGVRSNIEHLRLASWGEKPSLSRPYLTNTLRHLCLKSYATPIDRYFSHTRCVFFAHTFYEIKASNSYWYWNNFKQIL